MADPNASMTNIVEFQIRTDETTASEWLDEWQKRAQDALDAEPDTTAYATATSLEDESCVLVYERYARGIESLNFHTGRPSHTALTETMAARRMKKRRVMSAGFYDVREFGWWERGGKTRILSGAIIGIMGMRFAEDAHRSEFIRITQAHGDYCWAEEPDTLIYSGGIVARDAECGSDIKQGDLIFIMGCTDAAAFEKHNLDPQHIAIGQQFVKAGIEMTGSFFKQYRTTGHGFLAKDE